MAAICCSAHSAIANRQYCVIDLSTGANASSYPVKYLDEQPKGGFNTDEYKKETLVMRLIEPGTFKMEGHLITLSKPYYIGVFEVTQKQYELVMGRNPSVYKGDMRPVEHVNRKDVRGDSAAYDWPTSETVAPESFVGILRARTGLRFDLPTEAQWEYACRAGTTGPYNGCDPGSTLAALGRYAWNLANKGGYDYAHTTVGMYLPNAWGLYDMHGNVWEKCLDWHGRVKKGDDPKGPSVGTYRILRGGGWTNNPNLCTSFYRYSYVPSNAYSDVGVRLAVICRP